MCCLLYNIRAQYNFSYVELIRISPRFAIMLLAMILSIIFTVMDICATTGVFNTSLPIGNNPFWKLSFVFKCLTDTVILDDFKTALDKLLALTISRIADQSTNWSRRFEKPRIHNATTRQPDVKITRRTREPKCFEPCITLDSEAIVDSFEMVNMGKPSVAKRSFASRSWDIQGRPARQDEPYVLQGTSAL